MLWVSKRSTLCIATLILVLTSIAFIINYFVFKFPGNNYFPDNIPLLFSILFFFNLGLRLQFDKNSYQQQAGKELIYLFLVMSIVAFATNAIQLTPFPIIDNKIVSLETRLNINLSAILTWTSTHPNLKSLLRSIYDTLPYQMSIIPIVLIASGRFLVIREYYFLLLFTTLIGFFFYYFFPTTAPASVINSPYFSSEQLATGLKFKQIHSYIIPETNEGGLIALPSFHVIWALLCVYLLKNWRLLCLLLLIMNTVLIASCVLLGWHYPTDVLGGLLLVILSIYLLKKRGQV